MKKRATFSPVLLELIVAILFFALAMSVVVQLIAAANETSSASALTSRALIAMESAAEQLKADPVGDGAFDESGERRFTVEPEEGMQLSVTVRRILGAAGTLYEFEITAAGSGKPLGSLSAARYVSGEVGA